MNKFDENNFIATIIGALNKIQAVILPENAEGESEKLKAQDFGIKYSFDDEEKCTVDLHLTVEFGASILERAWEVQTSVKEALSQSGINVDKVHIHVKGVEQKEVIDD